MAPVFLNVNLTDQSRKKVFGPQIDHTVKMIPLKQHRQLVRPLEDLDRIGQRHHAESTCD
jgi:hypothetical protein